MCMPKWSYNGKTYGGTGKTPCTQDPADLKDLAFWSKKTGTKFKVNRRCRSILKQFGMSILGYSSNYLKVYSKGQLRGKCYFPMKSINEIKLRIKEKIHKTGRSKGPWFPSYCATCDPKAKKGKQHFCLPHGRPRCTSFLFLLGTFYFSLLLYFS